MNRKILEFLPALGDKKARKKWAELERKAGTLPVFFALFVMEWVKVRTAQLPIPVPKAEKWLLAGIACGLLYVYDVNLSEASEKAKETGKKAKEKAEEKMEGEE